MAAFCPTSTAFRVNRYGCSQMSGGRDAGQRKGSRVRFARNARRSPRYVMQVNSPNSISSGDEKDAEANDDSEPIEVDAEVRDMSLEEIKAELLTATNGTDRGFAASKEARTNILSLVAQLESQDMALSLPDDPAPLVGTWRLIFTSALDVLSLGLLPLSRVGNIYQNVETSDKDNELAIYNIVELNPKFAPVLNAFDSIGETVTRITVTATGTLQTGSRLDLKFVRSALQGVSILGFDLSSLPKLEVPVNSPVGYVDTTFIDDTMRIAKGPPTPNSSQPNVFILVKE